ncbi:hypothetical protein GCM10027405_07390 [Arthrobacter alkaliphilus]
MIFAYVYAGAFAAGLWAMITFALQQAPSPRLYIFWGAIIFAAFACARNVVVVLTAMKEMKQEDKPPQS